MWEAIFKGEYVAEERVAMNILIPKEKKAFIEE